MSFGTYARRVRDRDLVLRRRHSALRCAVGCYCPLGFNATWSLSTAGDLRSDEGALLRALDMVELSRNVWLAEMSTFADRRRTEKRRHRRIPSAAEVGFLLGWRWPGPQGHQVMFREIGLCWAGHLEHPFPDVPTADKDDLVYLDSTVAGCVSTYLHNGGVPGRGHRAILLSCLPELRMCLARLGCPAIFPEAFGDFRRLLKIAELIVNDTFTVHQ